MSVDIPVWLGVISGIVVLGGTLAGAAALFKTSYQSSVIEVQGKTIAAYKEHQDQMQVDHTTEMGKLREELSATQAEVDHYKASLVVERTENTVLREALSGKAEFGRLESLLMEHHDFIVRDRQAAELKTDHFHSQMTQVLADLRNMIGDRRHTEERT